MARRRKSSGGKRRRRRNPGALLVNPGRRRRRAPRRHSGGRRRRRRNPAFFRSLKHGFSTVAKTAIPAAIGGLILGIVDAQLLSKTKGGMAARLGIKTALAALLGAFTGRFLGEAGAAAATATVMGSIGHELGVRLGGGVVAINKLQGVHELVAMAQDDGEVQAELAALATDGSPTRYDGVNMVNSLAEYELMAGEDDSY